MNNTKIKSILSIFLGIIIILLFTKGEIISLEENFLQKEELEKKLVFVENEYKKLDLVDKYFKGLKKDKELELEIDKEKYLFLKQSKNNIEKYLITLKEDEILKFFYSQIDRLNRGNSNIKINSLSISSPKINSIKFLESDIVLNLNISSKDKLLEVLKFIVTTGKYKFFIKELNYDDFELSVDGNSNSNINIPLKILYK